MQGRQGDAEERSVGHLDNIARFEFGGSSEGDVLKSGGHE